MVSVGKAGIIMHWGVHSVAGIEPSWAMCSNIPWGYFSVPEYHGIEQYMTKLAPRFNPQHYDPRQWIAAAKDAGFTYAVLTTKHHDGYTLWPSSVTRFGTHSHMNGRDLLQPFVDACREYGIKVGFYFSPPDWSFPTTLLTVRISIILKNIAEYLWAARKKFMNASRNSMNIPAFRFASYLRDMAGSIFYGSMK